MHITILIQLESADTKNLLHIATTLLRCFCKWDMEIVK